MSPNRKKRRAALKHVPPSIWRKPQRGAAAVLGKELAVTAAGIVFEDENPDRDRVLVMVPRDLPQAEIAAELRLLADELEK